MYIHLGQEKVVKSSEIIGIFDLESTTISQRGREFLNKAEKRGEVVTVSFELPKSFILCSEKGSKKSTVYISQISSQTLQKRSGMIINSEK